MKSRNAKRISVVIVNPPPGGHDFTSLAHARRYVARGVARFTDTGSLEFLHRRAAANGPKLEVSAKPTPAYYAAAGGFLRYPQPSMSMGPTWRALGRTGAGL